MGALLRIRALIDKKQMEGRILKTRRLLERRALNHIIEVNRRKTNKSLF